MCSYTVLGGGEAGGEGGVRRVHKDEEGIPKEEIKCQLNNELQEDDLPNNTIAQSQQQATNSKTNQSSGKAANFFEGVEKLLEVWFTWAGGGTDASDLRNIPRYL
jgi:hypothetical protein